MTLSQLGRRGKQRQIARSFGWVGWRDGRYPVVLQHSIEHPTSIFTDSEPPMLPLAVQIVGAGGSETLVTFVPRVEEG